MLGGFFIISSFGVQRSGDGGAYYSISCYSQSYDVRFLAQVLLCPACPACAASLAQWVQLQRGLVGSARQGTYLPIARCASLMKRCLRNALSLRLAAVGAPFWLPRPLVRKCPGLSAYGQLETPIIYVFFCLFSLFFSFRFLDITQQRQSSPASSGQLLVTKQSFIQ